MQTAETLTAPKLILEQAVRPPRPWPSIVISASVGALGLLILCEFLLRFIAGFGNPILYKPDAACGYISLPNQHLRRIFAHTDLNAHGLRCPEFPLQKALGTVRILFLGDSIVYGTTRVDQSQIFAELVRKRLEVSTARHIEEVNASANGWAIGNESGYIRSRGIYNSDFVVEVINSGDLPQPFASIDDTAAAVTHRPALAIGDLLSHVVHRGSQQDPGTTPQSNAVQEQANLAELSRIKGFVEAQNSRFLVVFLPFRQCIPGGAKSSAPGQLVEWARQTGTPMIDLTPALSNHATAQVTNPDHIHMNALGNQLVAGALTPYLRQIITTEQHP